MYRLLAATVYFFSARHHRSSFFLQIASWLIAVAQGKTTEFAGPLSTGRVARAKPDREKLLPNL
jgi:hypothetical protein